MITTIHDDKGAELATVITVGEYSNHEKVKFFSDPSESLQVGSLLFHKGDSVQPHIHRSKDVGTAYPIVEMILVIRGTTDVDIYDEERKLVTTVTITAGTILLLRRGGHGFRFPQYDTRLLDIRCGPYVDKKNDKEMIS